ncbi:fibrobacter succinogenes major paralogous domain-containing protein [Pedobacter sp. N23S346]|uniref:fibrobacter succinogenes major paralogous domain-containing protein n=1 Tax=Pedobacter sp. N23S346 TaxID=3402750 RepID=UPI003AD5A747
MKIFLIKNIAYLISFLFITIVYGCGNSDTFTDIDGNIYHSVQIGKQTWMVENLKTTRFRNGDTIAQQDTKTGWKATDLPAYSAYNLENSNIKDYGLLYNWYCIGDKREIAPKGWRIPTETDLNELLQFIGSDTIAATLLKEAGNLHWLPSPTTGTNSTGFSARPGGYRDVNGNFYMRQSNGYYWTTQGSFEMYHWSSRVFQAFANIQRDPVFMKYGFSIRCIKDTDQ